MSTKLINKKLKHMFPEYRELMQTLVETDAHFARLLHQHDDLDREITHLEQDQVNLINDDIECLKRKKLKLKDAMYLILQKHAHNPVTHNIE